MEKSTNYFVLEGQYDSKHINNLSTKAVPQSVLDAVEKGCSIEDLERIAKGYPICKYKTQITIHGVFPATSTNRIGEYVNLVQNKNKSIGVRWSAIDNDKKTRLYTLLKFDSDWHVEHNSQVYSIFKQTLLNGKEDPVGIAKEMKAFADSIDRSLFRGNVECYLAQVWGMRYVVLSVNILSFYEKNFEALFTNLSGGRSLTETKERYAEHVKAEQKRREEEHAKWEQERKERAAKKEAARAKFLEEHPLENFKKVEKVIKPGDIVARLKTNWRDEWYWEYSSFKMHAGRLMGFPCDINGKKTGKGWMMDCKVMYTPCTLMLKIA